MKNRIKSVCMVLIIMFLTMSVSAQWITDSEYGFKINVPNSWNKEKKQEGTDRLHDFLDPTENIFIEVRAFEASDDMTADLLAQVFESSGLPGAEKLAFENYTLNGTPGKFGAYKTTINGLTVGVGAFYTVTKDFAYILWSLIPVNVYDQYSAAGDAVLNTFTVIPRKAKPIAVKPKPNFEITSFKLSDQITSEYRILNEKSKYPVTTDNIWLVYTWKGNAEGSKIDVIWYYEGGYIEGPSKGFTMPDYPDGFGYANISMDGAFAVGKYSVEVKMDGQIIGSTQFEVYKQQSNTPNIKPPGSTNNSSWGKANSGVSSANTASKGAGNALTVILGGGNNFYSFKKGKINSHDNADIMNEPWCTELPALCGNWAKTGKSQLSQVTSAPSSGYISDNSGYMDCQQVPLNEVLVFKLKDGTYAKVIIVNDQFSKTSSGCDHKITLNIEYPAF